MLQRAPHERRYPILVAFLQQTLVDLTDEIIELYDRRLAGAYANARKEIEDFRASVSRARNEKVLLLREIAELIVDEAITDEALRRAIYSRQPRERLKAVIEECNQIVRPRSDPYYDFLAKPKFPVAIRRMRWSARVVGNGGGGFLATGGWERRGARTLGAGAGWRWCSHRTRLVQPPFHSDRHSLAGRR